MNAFLITKGEYDDFQIVASFSTKEKAQDTVDLLNAGLGFIRYEIMGIPQDTVEGFFAGFSAEFNFVDHSDEVTMDNIVFKEALFEYTRDVVVGSHVIRATAKTKEECFDLILNELTKPKPVKREDDNGGAIVWEMYNLPPE